MGGFIPTDSVYTRENSRDNEKNISPKFNIAPEKWWLEDYFPIGKVSFRG